MKKRRSLIQREILSNYATVFRVSDNKVAQEGDKNPLGLPIYWEYESFDPNDGRGEIRVPKRES